MLGATRVHAVPVVQWPRTLSSQGGNIGSNPVGDAIRTSFIEPSFFPDFLVTIRSFL
jgi:hypothetical protein